MGEIFIFLFIMQYVKDAKQNVRYGIYAILFAGLILFSITFLNIIIIGPEAMTFGIFPAMRGAKRIDIKQYIQRFDLLIANIFILDVLVKTFVLIFVSKELIQKIIPVKKDNLIYIILCLIVSLSLFFVGKNYTLLLLFRQKVFITYVNLTFEFIIPIVLITISMIHKLIKNLKLKSNA